MLANSSKVPSTSGDGEISNDVSHGQLLTDHIQRYVSRCISVNMQKRLPIIVFSEVPETNHH